MTKLTLTLCLMISIAITQNDCSKFKIGTFENIDNGSVKSQIVRNDSIQLESHGAKEIKLKIKWIDNCTYQLTLISGNDAFWNGRPKDMPTPDLIVRILETNEDSYVQESKYVTDDEFAYRSTMRKVKVGF